MLLRWMVMVHYTHHDPLVMMKIFVRLLVRPWIHTMNFLHQQWYLRIVTAFMYSFLHLVVRLLMLVSICCQGSFHLELWMESSLLLGMVHLFLSMIAVIAFGYLLPSAYRVARLCCPLVYRAILPDATIVSGSPSNGKNFEKDKFFSTHLLLLQTLNHL